MSIGRAQTRGGSPAGSSGGPVGHGMQGRKFGSPMPELVVVDNDQVTGEHFGYGTVRR